MARMKVWTPNEIFNLRQLAREGVQPAEIAKHLGRTKASVDNKIGELGEKAWEPATLSAIGWAHTDPEHLS